MANDGGYMKMLIIVYLIGVILAWLMIGKRDIYEMVEEQTPYGINPEVLRSIVAITSWLAVLAIMLQLVTDLCYIIGDWWHCRKLKRLANQIDKMSTRLNEQGIQIMDSSEQQVLKKVADVLREQASEYE